MTTNRAVREIYERYPYPETPEGRPSTTWRLPPPPWLISFWRPGETHFGPRRILVAGSGTGREAFALARRVPEATIVAVDLSPRSIAVARASARRLFGERRIQFLVADLADSSLARKTGGSFDFISCHGVLSYVPSPLRVLRALRRCLSDEGALYLGVNGRVHHSVRWRETLPAFGLDVRTWPETAESRRVLAMLDAMAARTPTPRLARKPASYLSGDVFGPPIRNLALAEWLDFARRAGWQFRGSTSCGESLRGLCDEGHVAGMLPRTRAEVHAVEDLLIPSAFHGLLFTKKPPPRAPWHDPDALLEWRVVRLPLFRIALPARPPGMARFASRPLNLLVETRVDAVVASVLRSRRPMPLGQLARSTRTRVNARALRDTLYMLYLLGVLEALPPSS